MAKQNPSKQSAGTNADGSKGDEKYGRDWWIAQLDAEEKAHAAWRKQGREADKQYRDDEKTSKTDASAYPLFWSTIKVEHAAVYAERPKPDVRRRWSDMQGPQKTIAQCIERALLYAIDDEMFDDPCHRAVDDFLVRGLGCAKVVYHAETGTRPVTVPGLGTPVMAPMLDEESGEPGEAPEAAPPEAPMTEDYIKTQSVSVEFVPWDRVRWEPCTAWGRQDWTSFDVPMRLSEIRSTYPNAKLAKEIVKDTGGESSGENNLPQALQKYSQVYIVHEIWCRTTKKIYVVSKAVEGLIDSWDDQLKLKKFFPCPMPMFANLESAQCSPMPDWYFGRRQFKYVNTVTTRMERLTEQLKDVGFYDASLGELSELMNAQDGTLKPITDLLARLDTQAGRATFDSIICKQDNSTKIVVLQKLSELRDQKKEEIYEIFGIADILRGASKATETATAQTIKGQWASIRLSTKQQAMGAWFRGLFRIMAEIFAEHFTAEQLFAMTGIQLDDQMMAMLRDDELRCYAIDVETDSFAAQDEEADKQASLEMVKAVSDALNTLMPAVANGMLPADLVKEMILVVARSFKSGRALEDQLEQLTGTVQQMQGMQQQAQQGQQAAQQMQGQMQQLQAQASQQIRDLQTKLQELAQQLQQTQADLEAAQAPAAQAKAMKDAADAKHTMAEAQRKEIENARVAAGLTPTPEPPKPAPTDVGVTVQ